MGNPYQDRIDAINKKLRDHADHYGAILAKAKEEGRQPTDDDRKAIGEDTEAIELLKKELAEAERNNKTAQEVEALSRDIGATREVAQGEVKPKPEPKRAKTLGDQFIASESYKARREKGFAGRWSTGQIDLDTKATLVEGDNIFLDGGSPGEGAALVPLDTRPGVLPTLFERLTVADLFASGTTNSNAINYIIESVATNAAEVVPEAGDKPESTLEYEQAQETVKKIATFLPVSDEMLEDAAALRGYINSRLTFFVQQQEEEQLLHGAGNNNNFLGLLPRVPVENRFVTSDAEAPNAADHIYAALTTVRVGSFLEPDGVVIHPDDWAALRLLKDDNENYIGGSPFANTGMGEPSDSLWGKRVVVTQAMVPGAAVVGAFNTAAQVFRRTGLMVEASNSHDDFFVQNLTAIRAEERLALAVYRPAAFAIADLGYAS